jgi:flagellar biosynthesis/type III secretory pathway ATPase
MSKKQLSPLQRVLVEQQQDKNMSNQKENTLTMPLIQQKSTIAKRQLLNSLSETKVRPGNNWLSESMDIHGKPVDLGATHSHFLKT